MPLCPSCGESYDGATVYCPRDGARITPPGLAGANASPSDPPDDLIGRAIGGYRITSRIGRGGMGAVYLGEHPTLRKRVAIKILLSELSASSDLRRRFLDEARAVAALESPYIVTIHDLAELPDGRSYIVMEHLDGEPLSRLLARRGILPPAEAAAVCVQALDGLATAHARGIVHRDIKPDNLFLARGSDGTQRLKILDFGIAKLRGDGLAHTATRAGALLGTPAYMSPEQASGNARAVDPRADLYSLGVVLYELLAGRPPFVSDSFAHLLVLHLTETPPPLGLVPGMTPALESVVRRSLAKAPGDRFATAAAMSSALSEAVGGVGRLPAGLHGDRSDDRSSPTPPIAGFPHGTPHAADQDALAATLSPSRAVPSTIHLRRRRAIALGLAATVLLALLTVSGVVLRRRGRSASPQPPRVSSTSALPVIASTTATPPATIPPATRGEGPFMPSAGSSASPPRAEPHPAAKPSGRVAVAPLPSPLPSPLAPTVPAPPSGDEYCDVDVTDESGGEHRWGGARVPNVAAPGAAMIVHSVSGTSHSVTCVAAAHGGYVSATLVLPGGSASKGSHSLDAAVIGSVGLLGSGYLPAGFHARYYASNLPGGSGHLTVRAFEPRAGAPFEGTLEGTFAPAASAAETIRARVRFRFLQ